MFLVYFKFVGKPFTNDLITNCFNPSLIKLTPNLRKSYKMFFQKVTHSHSTSFILFIRRICMAPLPCYYGERAGVRGTDWQSWRRQSLCQNCRSIFSRAIRRSCTKCTSESEEIAEFSESKTVNHLSTASVLNSELVFL